VDTRRCRNRLRTRSLRGSPRIRTPRSKWPRPAPAVLDNQGQITEAWARRRSHVGKQQGPRLNSTQPKRANEANHDGHDAEHNACNPGRPGNPQEKGIQGHNSDSRSRFLAESNASAAEASTGVCKATFTPRQGARPRRTPLAAHGLCPNARGHRKRSARLVRERGRYPDQQVQERAELRRHAASALEDV